MSNFILFFDEIEFWDYAWMIGELCLSDCKEFLDSVLDASVNLAFMQYVPEDDLDIHTLPSLINCGS